MLRMSHLPPDTPDDLADKVIAHIQSQGFKIHDVSMDGCVLIQAPFIFDNDRRNQWFMVGDNGGEFNVVYLNSQEPSTPVAYTDRYGTFNAATIAYRVMAALKGNPIDYTARLDDWL